MSSPKPCPSPCHPADPRPHVAALLELSALGWHVSEMRPDRTAPALWRVTVRRHDGNASFTVTEVDPDAALEELLRYADADADAEAEGTRAAILDLEVRARAPGLDLEVRARAPGLDLEVRARAPGPEEP